MFDNAIKSVLGIAKLTETYRNNDTYLNYVLFNVN